MRENIPIGEPVEEESKVSYVFDKVKEQFSTKKFGRNAMYTLSLVNSAGFGLSLATGSYIGIILCGLGTGCSLAGGYMLDSEEEERKCSKHVSYIID